MRRINIIGILFVIAMSIAGMVTGFTVGDDAKLAPAAIKITGDAAQRIKDAYTNKAFADQQLEYVVLDAKYNLNVPKDYLFDPATFSFVPPKPKAESKP